MIGRFGLRLGLLIGGLGLINMILPTAPGADLAPLHVQGAKLVDARGEPVCLRGVNAASLEWTASGKGPIRDTVRRAVRDWQSNVVRIPLSQDRWFGRAPGQEDGGVAYRALVAAVVAECHDGGAYAILDLHWSDGGEWGQAIGQHRMPDRHSVAFWQDYARTYANQPGVLFDLDNEPHDVSWDVWLRGGPVTEQGRTWEAVGMQPLLDAVRATGAKNVAIVGGLNWAYDLDGRQLRDPHGSGVVYANHADPFKGDSVLRWVSKLERAAQVVPILVGEFGSDPDGGHGLNGEEWVRQVLAALDAHDWSWTAWDMHPTAGPSLIRDYNGTPTPHFGALVKQALRRDPVPAPTSPGQPWGIFDGSGDVGTVQIVGSAAFDPATAAYTLTGSGANMWFGTDACQFVWKRVAADEVNLAANIAWLGAGRNPHRKACLMIRQSLDANSPQVGAVVHGDGLTSLQFRDGVGVNTHEIQSNLVRPTRVALDWRNNVATLSLSTAANRPVAFSGAATRIGFAAPFYVGIAVSSHEADTAETATFTGLTLRSGPAPGVAPALPPATRFVSVLETQAIGSTDRRVVQVFEGRIAAPTWTPDGASLLYNAEGRIDRIPATGGAGVRVDTGSAITSTSVHAVSPDGTILAFSGESGPDGPAQLSRVPLAGGAPQRLTLDNPSREPAWSPDGQSLAFAGQGRGRADIFTIPAGGGDETRLTIADETDDCPAFAPDGRTIFFNSDRSGAMQIYRMNADGSDQRPVFRDERPNWSPHPSPDGKKLVFVSYERFVRGHPADQNVEVRQLDLASGRIEVLARLLGGQGTLGAAPWSPDGRRIALVSYHRIADWSR